MRLHKTIFIGLLYLEFGYLSIFSFLICFQNFLDFGYEKWNFS